MKVVYEKSRLADKSADNEQIIDNFKMKNSSLNV